MKVRLLNGTHSLIAYLGALSGADTIPEAIASPDIEQAARAVLAREYVPSIEAPEGVDLDDYQRELFVRWGNSALGHRTRQVGTDGSVKLRQRIPEPALLALGQERMPHLIALTVAAYLTCLAPLPGVEPGESARAMADVARARLVDIADASRTGRGVAEGAIADLRLFGAALAERTDFIDRVGELVDTIARAGVSAAIADAVAASGSSGAALRPELSA
jgi:fructuronate reductase